MAIPIQPQEVSDFDTALPTQSATLLPGEEAIPAEFYDTTNAWHVLASRWFYDGLPQATVYEPKDGIDHRVAMRHLRAVLGSFHVSYRHKVAAVAYMLSLWYSRIDPDAAF
jgi:hypothetical protein